jgi:hypothetical protein
MTKRKKLAAEPVKEKPVAQQKPAADPVREGPIAKSSPYGSFHAATLLVTSPTRFFQDEESRSKLTQDSLELYVGLKPRNAQEAMNHCLR